jgi:CheY-like chemotaxis protein
VLVVDDDGSTASKARAILAVHRFNVWTAGNGMPALDLARAENPALILLDLNASSVDGYSIIKQLKQDPGTCDIPVVVLTQSAALNVAGREAAVALGAGRFASNRFSIQELAEEIDLVMSENGRSA